VIAQTAKTSRWVRLADLFPWSTRLLVVLAAALTVAGVVVAAGDGRGDIWWAGLYLATGVIPTAWAVLQPLWRADGASSAIFVALQRCVLIPLIVGPILAVVSAVVVLLPPVAQRITDSRLADGWHYYFPADGGAPVYQALVLGGLAGIFIPMLVGLALSVVVVVPWVAFRRPREFAEANMLDTSEKSAAANSTAGKLFAVVLVLVFAVPTLIVVGSREASANDFWQLFATWPLVFTNFERYWGDAMWMLGVVLAPLTLVIAIVVRLVQRPDRARRAAAGVNAFGDGGDRS
jgi:hypothetical protein